MARTNGRTTGLEDMNDIQMVPLPPSPVTPSSAKPEEVSPSEPERQELHGSTVGRGSDRGREDAYIPESTKREPTTTLTLRLPVSMKVELQELVEEHKTDMSKFIVGLLGETMPLVPRRKKKS